MILPATPLAIELTVRHRRPWWRVEDWEQWQVSADVSSLVPCGEVFRHVADLAIDLVDLQRCASDNGGGWAERFVAEAVVDQRTGRLHPELEERAGDGVARVVILRSISVAKSWRGQGLAGVLIAAALRTWAHSARLGVCHVAVEDFADLCPDQVAAKLAVARMVSMLERLGFSRWRGAHVVDLSDPALVDARLAIIGRSWPDPDDSHGMGRAGR